jgi:hypothetical protein
MSDSGRTLGQTCGFCGTAHPESDAETCRLVLASQLEQLRGSAWATMCDSLKELRTKAELERDGYRKSYELMQKGMESQCELMDGLKQQVRQQTVELEKSRVRIGDLERAWSEVREMYEHQFPDRPWGACPPEQRTGMLLSKLTHKLEGLRDLAKRLVSVHEAVDAHFGWLLELGSLTREEEPILKEVAAVIVEARETLKEQL